MAFKATQHRTHFRLVREVGWPWIRAFMGCHLCPWCTFLFSGVPAAAMSTMGSTLIEDQRTLQVENIGASTVASASREQLVYIIDASKAVGAEALEILTVRIARPCTAQLHAPYIHICRLSAGAGMLRLSSCHECDRPLCYSHGMLAGLRRYAALQDAVLNPKFANNDVKAAAAKLEEDVKTLADNPQSLLLEARPQNPAP